MSLNFVLPQAKQICFILGFTFQNHIYSIGGGPHISSSDEENIPQSKALPWWAFSSRALLYQKADLQYMSE
jgi:hypothetical protein